MAIDLEDVRHVAKLARLDMPEEELSVFAEQLGRIVEYFDKLEQLDVSNEQPMMHAAEGATLRDDVPGPRLPRKDALEGAPSAGDGFFRVPPIIE